MPELSRNPNPAEDVELGEKIKWHDVVGGLTAWEECHVGLFDCKVEKWLGSINASISLNGRVLIEVYGFVTRRRAKRWCLDEVKKGSKGVLNILGKRGE